MLFGLQVVSLAPDDEVIQVLQFPDQPPAAHGSVVLVTKAGYIMQRCIQSLLAQSVQADKAEPFTCMHLQVYSSCTQQSTDDCPCEDCCCVYLVSVRELLGQMYMPGPAFAASRVDRCVPQYGCDKL